MVIYPPVKKMKSPVPPGDRGGGMTKHIFRARDKNEVSNG